MNEERNKFAPRKKRRSIANNPEYCVYNASSGMINYNCRFVIGVGDADNKIIKLRKVSKKIIILIDTFSRAIAYLQMFVLVQKPIFFFYKNKSRKLNKNRLRKDRIAVVGTRR